MLLSRFPNSPQVRFFTFFQALHFCWICFLISLPRVFKFFVNSKFFIFSSLGVWIFV
jgi:hypothetical protein